MRTSVFLTTLVMLITTAAFAADEKGATPELLARGIEHYRAGNYSAAVSDLETAAHVTPAMAQSYVATGRMPNHELLEQALVYLALSQSRLGREGDARESVLRLLAAEQIAPAYAGLNVPDAAEYEALVTRLVPQAALRSSSTPLPLVQPQVAQQTTEPTETTQPTETTKKPVQQTIAEQRAERERLVEELVAKERERIQREADARIAEVQRQIEAETQQRIQAAEAEAAQRIAAAQREAETKVAAVQNEAATKVAAVQNDAATKVAAVQNDAAAKVAAVQNDADARVRAAEAAAQRDAEAKVRAAQETAQREAEARAAALQRETEQRIASERAAAAAQVAEIESNQRRRYLESLRTAETLANTGDPDGAAQEYARVAASENVPREVLIAAAVGLYRTGAFREAVTAFRRAGTFAKGEEDLRYYHAVALYETGNYEDARKELACALPFIQLTDDVQRMRAKVEQSAGLQASR